jgi:DNA-3-methyladenine glycosylase
MAANAPSPWPLPPPQHDVEAFFGRPVDVVATELLGSLISCGGVTLELTEVEAYAGLDDPASHSYRGPTPRNEVMFGPPGRVYVYFIYGMHWAVNLVCQQDGHASACLLRAGRILAGHELAAERRGEVPDHQLARGPGNLASAIGASGSMTGSTLWEGPILWRPRRGDDQPDIQAGPRVGVSLAADVPHRFWIVGDPSVSAYRRSKRA